MLTTPLPASMDCPSCAAVIAFDRRFTPWCAACDWNVDAGVAAWFVLLAGGLALILGGNGIVVAILGAFVLALALITRPRLGSADKHALTPAEAPETYRLLDEISTALGTPRIASIALDGDWNAGTYRFGLRHCTAIILGLPVWRALRRGAAGGPGTRGRAFGQRRHHAWRDRRDRPRARLPCGHPSLSLTA